MAKVNCVSSVSAKITLELSEEEAAALDAIVGYGVDPFLKVFYQHLGQHYLKPHESGVRSLFESVRTGDADMQSFLNRAKKAREAFEVERKP